MKKRLFGGSSWTRRRPSSPFVVFKLPISTAIPKKWALARGSSHEIVATCQAPDTDTTKQRIEEASRASLLWVKKRLAFARIVLDEMFTAKPDFHQKAFEASKALLIKIQTILSEAREKGEVRADRPLDHLALTFLGLQNLALLQYWGTSGTVSRWRDAAIVTDQCFQANDERFNR